MHLFSLLLRRYFLILPAAAYLIIYIITALNRIFYPYEIEWMEGGMLVETMRIIKHLPLYTKPSIYYEPYCYTPLYFYISAFFSLIFGHGFYTLRLVSFIASLANFYLIYLIVKKYLLNNNDNNNNNITANIFGLIAAGLFAAMYKISGAWYDVGRVDSLFLSFILGGIYLLTYAENTKNYIFSGLLFAAAFLTKQTGLLFAFFIIIFVIIINLKLNRIKFALVFILSFLITSIIASIYFIYISSNFWYYFYIFKIHSCNPLVKDIITSFWTKDIFELCPISLIITIITPVILLFIKKYSLALLSLSVIIGSFTVSWLGRIHFGGYLNAIIPACMAMAIYTAIGGGLLFSYFSKKKFYLIIISLQILIFIQFLLFYYNPRKYIPTKNDKENAAKFIDFLKSIDGEIIIPAHAYYPLMAGKSNTYAQTFASGLFTTDLEDIKQPVIDELSRALTEKRFAAIIIDTPPFLDLFKNLNAFKNNYTGPEKINYIFYPPTGFKTRPAFLYYLKK